LHEIGLPYKTNLECESTKLLIDIGIVDQKIALIFVDRDESICELKNEQRTYSPSTFIQMKGDLLQRVGWNVIYIIYDIWNIQNDTKEKKEYDIRIKIEKTKSSF
jgi:hypothetical protein